MGAMTTVGGSLARHGVAASRVYNHALSLRSSRARGVAACDVDPRCIRLFRGLSWLLCMCVSSAEAPARLRLTGQCTFKRLLSKRLVCNVDTTPPPPPGACVPHVPTTAICDRSQPWSVEVPLSATQVFADFELAASQPPAGAAPPCSVDLRALELVISARNGAGEEELTLWRHTIR